jgi:uncharacterized integral membrane protein
MLPSLKFILGLIIMILLVTFAVKNNTPTKLYYYFNLESPEVPLFLVILLGLFLGAVFVWIINLFERMKLKYIIKKKDKKIREIEKELVSLRNLPIEESLSNKKDTNLLSEGPDKFNSKES